MQSTSGGILVEELSGLPDSRCEKEAKGTPGCVETADVVGTVSGRQGSWGTSLPSAVPPRT